MPLIRHIRHSQLSLLLRFSSIRYIICAKIFIICYILLTICLCCCLRPGFLFWCHSAWWFLLPSSFASPFVLRAIARYDMEDIRCSPCRQSMLYDAIQHDALSHYFFFTWVDRYYRYMLFRARFSSFLSVFFHIFLSFRWLYAFLYLPLFFRFELICLHARRDDTPFIMICDIVDYYYVFLSAPFATILRAYYAFSLITIRHIAFIHFRYAFRFVCRHDIAHFFRACSMLRHIIYAT